MSSVDIIYKLSFFLLDILILVLYLNRSIGLVHWHVWIFENSFWFLRFHFIPFWLFLATEIDFYLFLDNLLILMLLFVLTLLRLSCVVHNKIITIFFWCFLLLFNLSYSENIELAALSHTFTRKLNSRFFQNFILLRGETIISCSEIICVYILDERPSVSLSHNKYKLTVMAHFNKMLLI